MSDLGVAYLTYSPVGGALGAGPGPSRLFRRFWRQKIAIAMMATRTATPAIVPPTIAPVRSNDDPDDVAPGASVGVEVSVVEAGRVSVGSVIEEDD